MPELSPGSEIAGYRIEAVAGRGGMGVVYRATQLALQRRVAVKVIAPDLARDDAFQVRFQREARIAASIEHPNAIPVYEAGERDGVLYLVMRWVEGTDLRMLLAREGPLEPRRAAALLVPVASALHAAHRRGLIHRDVKPANVLIAFDEEEGEHPYLTDFGIARHAEPTTGEVTVSRTGSVVGTLDYMAPERIRGGRGDAQSDVYAFGCMLFQALAGHVPYPREHDVARIEAHLNELPPSLASALPDAPPALDAVVRKATAKAPEDRYATAAELARAVQEAAGAEPPTTAVSAVPSAGVESPPSPPPPPTPPTGTAPPPAVPSAPSRRRRIALVAGGAALLAGAVVAALLLTGVLAGGESGNQPDDVIQFDERPAPAAPRLVAATAPLFTLRAPAGWTRTDSTLGGGLQRSEWRSPDQPGASLLVDAIGGVSSTPAERGGRNRDRGAAKPGYQELAFRQTDLGGRQAYEWSYQLPGTRVVDYFLNECGDGYAVQGTAPPEVFERLAVSFRESAASLRSQSC